MIYTLYKQVEEVLASKIETRNSDSLLTVTIMERFYGAEWNRMTHHTILSLLRQVNQESVKRCRASIQNDPKNPRYLPTSWKVARMRKWKEVEWKSALGYSSMVPADYIEAYEQEKHFRSIQSQAQLSLAV